MEDLIKKFKYLYHEKLPLWNKIEKLQRKFIEQKISASNEVKKEIKNFENIGYGDLPVCIAKTQYSFTVDPKIKGAPTGQIPSRS